MICPRCEGTGEICKPSEMRKLRTSRCLKLGAVAKRMGVSAPYLSDLERGNRSWRVSIELRFRKAIEELS
jgi:transcriptional regulator with XRE-family HTH domain